MQMFNGITMKILGLHSVSFDQPIESRKAEETYENSENEQLKKIRTEINELNDGENTANDKIEIQGTLNKEFAEFLKNKPEIAKQLWDAVSSIEAEEGSDNAKAKADLLVFLKPIINPVDIKQDITDLNEEGGKFYEKNLDKSEDAITKVKSTINDIFGIIGEEAQEGENENITKYRNTINNIKKVLDKPNETNTKSLQKFILANLDGEAKDAFLEGNFRKDSEGNRNPENPDGLFGQATLNGVNAFLIKLEEHVNNIKGAEEIMSNNKKPIEPEGGLTGQVKTETTKPREQPIDTTPLDIKDGKYKGLHQVRADSQIVCQNAELNGATFYSLNVEGQESGEAPNESEFNGLMRLSNSPDEIFRVKIDKDGYLCPVIENCNSGKRILVKNNPSCIAYLQNKIPSGLPGNPRIVWNPNSKFEDYAIRSDATNYREGLTIEPMEIDGHGVSPDLSELLVMMNFVNYLRFNKKIDNIDFDNNDPDLRLNDQGKLEVRVDRKSNRTYDEKGNVVKNGRWYEVPDRFGLSGISPERIKNLIKFNNGEDWRDKWDKKKGNKYYDKMTLLKAEIQTVNPTAPVAPVEQSDGEPDAATGQPDAATGQPDAVTGQPDAVTVDEEDTDEVTTNKLLDSESFANLKFTDIVEKEENGKKYIEFNDKRFYEVKGEESFTGEGYKKLLPDNSEDGAGCIYFGSFKEGKADGQGTIVFQNGERYQGGFKNDNYEGKGVLIRENGSRYEGDFKNDQFDGNGKITYPDGGYNIYKTYEGHRKDGKRDGLGTCVFSDGLVYKGMWSEGLKNDKDGIYTWPNGNQIRGLTLGDKIQSGKLTIKSGDKEEICGIERENEKEQKVKIIDGKYQGKYFDLNSGEIITDSEDADSEEKVQNIKDEEIGEVPTVTSQQTGNEGLGYHDKIAKEYDDLSLDEKVQWAKNYIEENKDNGINTFYHELPINNLDVEVAKELSKFNGGLNFSRLRNLSDECAKILGKHKGSLRFDNVNNLNPDALNSLARSSEKDDNPESELVLGITTLDEEGARKLVNSRFNAIDLPNLSLLDDGIARQFGKYQGNIDITGVKSITEQQAKYLSTHGSNGNGTLWLGLDNISSESADALSYHNPLDLELRYCSDEARKIIEEKIDEKWDIEFVNRNTGKTAKFKDEYRDKYEELFGGI